MSVVLMLPFTISGLALVEVCISIRFFFFFKQKTAIEIVVADTGHGVTQEVKERLFLPYFSTKKRGTGLGLAIVRRIIEDHRGSIHVEENDPLGTRFVVELPLAVTDMPTETQNV